MQPRSPKYFRKFGPVTVTTGTEVKEIIPEQWVRIRKDTKECLLNSEGRFITRKKEKEERKQHETI
jgi:hypothetical protein